LTTEHEIPAEQQQAKPQPRQQNIGCGFAEELDRQGAPHPFITQSFIFAAGNCRKSAVDRSKQFRVAFSDRTMDLPGVERKCLTKVLFGTGTSQ